MLALLVACTPPFVPLPVIDTSDTDSGALDTEETGDTDTDTDPPDADAPTLVAFTLDDEGDWVRAAFDALDPDDDLVGGAFEVSEGGVDWESFAVPGGLLSFDGGAGVARIGRGPCDAGQNRTYQARLRDAAGHVGATRSAQVALGGSVVRVPDKGDAETDTSDVGTVSRGAILCGSSNATGNDGTVGTADLDRVVFQPAFAGSYRLALAWEEATDYDLTLFGPGGAQIGKAWTRSTASPEEMTRQLEAGKSYQLLVTAWSGDTGAWALTID